MTVENDTASAEAPPEFARWKTTTAIFLTGQTVSLLGSMIVQYAVMWHLTITTQSGSVLMFSIVFGMLPQAFVSVFGGVWADRHYRKHLVMGADAAIAVTTLALALLMASGVDDLWLIYAALAVRSAFAGVQTPAVSAIIPQIVPAHQLMRINGLNQTVQSGMMLLAPALAALVYAEISIVGAFFVDVVTAAAAIGLTLLVPIPRLSRASDLRTGYFDDLVAGLRYIITHRSVRWVMVLFAVAVLLVGAPSYLTPLMVTRTFGPEVWKLTANELFWSAGMLGGGAVLAVLGQRLRHRVAVLLGSALAMGLFTIGLGLSTNLWVFFAFGFLMGVTFPAMSTTSTTILQETVDAEMLGRVFGFVGIIMTVTMPLSMVVFGPLADVVSVESLLVAAGLILTVLILAAMATPSGGRALRERTAEAAPPAG